MKGIKNILYGAGARIVGLSGNIDRAMRVFDALRSGIVLGFLPDEFLRRYNDYIYAKKGVYRADSIAFREELFEWEKEAVRKFFPRQPAKILIGGAGGGREAFALAGMGYDVTAVEPCSALLETMRKRAEESGGRVKVVKGSYENIGEWDAEHPFDAVILGWGSISHAVNDMTIRTVFETTRKKSPGAPVLFSFLARSPDNEGKFSKLRFPTEIIKKAAPIKRPEGSSFQISAGYLRRFSADDIKRLADLSGYETAFLSSDVTTYPHAVFTAKRRISV